MTREEAIERRNWMLAMFRRGMSKIEIAHQFGLHWTRVGQILRSPEPTQEGSAKKPLDRRKKYSHLRYIGPADRPAGEKRGQYGRFRCVCRRVVIFRAAIVRSGRRTRCGCKVANTPREGRS